jgi:hypothetical protein
MDFQEYVAARRTSLVRAAVLLGAAEIAAPRVVRETVLATAGPIGRMADPDPVVYAALVREARAESARLPVGDDPGLAVRRRLAAMDPDRRAVAVLAFHADLTPHEIARALELEPDQVAAAEIAARTDLGVADRSAARDLLMLAGDTVPPPPGDAIVRPARSRLIPALAAAVVLVVALTAAAVAGRDRPSSVLDDDQVPSLFGYDVAAATELLSDRGLRVDQRRTRACDVVGTVVGTEPPVGTRFDRGDSITVRSAVPSGEFCMARYPPRAVAWTFLQWAADRGPAPEFAPAVEVVVDGSDPVTLTRREVADPERWGDPGVLTELRTALEAVYPVPGTSEYRTPTLEAAYLVPPLANCGVTRPVRTGDRQAVSLALSLDEDGPEHCPLTLDLYRTDGAIDAVVLYTEKPPP